MGFGEPTKLEYGAQLAAALGFVGLVNLERVGVGVVRERMAEGWSPARGRNQVLPLMDFLGRLRPGGTTSLNDGLAPVRAARARGGPRRRHLRSDGSRRATSAGSKALLERRFDVHVVHVLAPDEMNPSFGGDLRLVDAETGELRDLTLDGEAMRAYRQRLRDFLERAEQFCRAKEISYHRVVTDTPVEEFVLRQLKGLLLS